MAFDKPDSFAIFKALKAHKLSETSQYRFGAASGASRQRFKCESNWLKIRKSAAFSTLVAAEFACAALKINIG